MQDKLFETAFCRVEYLREYDAVFCRWKQFCHAAEYRSPLEYGLKLLEETQAQHWITDTSEGFESDPSDTLWMVETFLPLTLQSNCKTVTFIIDDDSPLKEEIDTQAEALSQYFTVRKIKRLDAFED